MARFMIPMVEEWELRTDFQGMVAQMLSVRDHPRLLQNLNAEQFAEIQDRKSSDLVSRLNRIRVIHKEWLLRQSTNMVLTRSDTLLKATHEDQRFIRESESEALGSRIAQLTGLGLGSKPI
jgi:hypothetical protein